MNHYAANSMQNKEDPQSWQHDQGEQLAKLRGARIQVWDQPVYFILGLVAVLLANNGPIWKVRPEKWVFTVYTVK